MRVALTGATGFIGKKLVFELLRSQHEVRILSRDPEKARKMFGNAVECLLWDPSKTESDPSSFRGIDAVIHLAGEGIADKRWTQAQKTKIYDSRILGTRHIVNTLKKMGDTGPKAFVCASAIGYYGDRGEEALDEGSPRGKGFLSDVCADWEFEAAPGPSNLRSVSVRIGIVLGTEGGALKKMLPIFKLGAGGPIASGNQWMSWIHVDDLVRLLIEAASNEKYEGPVNAVAPIPVRNVDFTRTLGQVLHRPTFLPAPAFALKLAMGELSVLVLSSQKVNPTVAIDNGFPFHFPELRSALRNLLKKKPYELERFHWIPKSKSEVFPFFADEKNLERITPPWLHFEVKKKTGAALSEGCFIDYRLRVRGVPLNWRSQILEWQPDHRFIDTQVVGPYRSWHHTHEFFPFRDGTLMRDRVAYEVPMVPFMDRLISRFVSSDLLRIFDYRQKRIDEIFGK